MLLFLWFSEGIADITAPPDFHQPQASTPRMCGWCWDGCAHCMCVWWVCLLRRTRCRRFETVGVRCGLDPPCLHVQCIFYPRIARAQGGSRVGGISCRSHTFKVPAHQQFYKHCLTCVRSSAVMHATGRSLASHSADVVAFEPNKQGVRLIVGSSGCWGAFLHSSDAGTVFRGSTPCCRCGHTCLNVGIKLDPTLTKRVCISVWEAHASSEDLALAVLAGTNSDWPRQLRSVPSAINQTLQFSDWEGAPIPMKT